MQIQDKRVVVTGAASGIGKALCEAFNKAGAKSVVCVDMNIEGATETANDINGLAAAKPLISLAVSVAPSIFISTQTTDLAPALLNASHKALPIPLAAPVTTTLLSCICINLVPILLWHLLAFVFLQFFQLLLLVIPRLETTYIQVS